MLGEGGGVLLSLVFSFSSWRSSSLIVARSASTSEAFFRKPSNSFVCAVNLERQPITFCRWPGTAFVEDAVDKSVVVESIEEVEVDENGGKRSALSIRTSPLAAVPPSAHFCLSLPTAPNKAEFKGLSLLRELLSSSSSS
jgi:hypothetical protein